MKQTLLKFHKSIANKYSFLPETLFSFRTQRPHPLDQAIGPNVNQVLETAIKLHLGKQLLEIILTRNNFQFNNNHHLQLCGCAMGRKYFFSDIHLHGPLGRNSFYPNTQETTVIILVLGGHLCSLGQDWTGQNRTAYTSPNLHLLWSCGGSKLTPFLVHWGFPVLFCKYKHGLMLN